MIYCHRAIEQALLRGTPLMGWVWNFPVFSNSTILRISDVWHLCDPGEPSRREGEEEKRASADSGRKNVTIWVPCMLRISFWLFISTLFSFSSIVFKMMFKPSTGSAAMQTTLHFNACPVHLSKESPVVSIFRLKISLKMPKCYMNIQDEILLKT